MANPNTRSAFTKAFKFINLKHIPGPRGFYFLLYVRHFQKNILEAFTRVHLEYTDIASFSWPMNSIIIYSPSMFKNVLVENSKSYIKGEQIEELRAIIGNGLATNNDYQSWVKSRALLATEFNNKAISQFINQFETITQKHISTFSGKIDMCESMKLLTFSIATQTLLGVTLNTADALMVNIAVHFTSVVTYKRIFKLFPIPYWVPTLTNIKFNNHYNNLNDLVMRLIQNERQFPTTHHNSVLQKLVHAKDEETNFSFNDDQLRDEVLTMLLAGHETSAHSLTWILGLLAWHPEIQEKLVVEILNVKNPDPSNYLSQMPYLKNVILESMRLYPAFPVLSRKAAIDIELGDYKIPKDTNVVLPIYVTQRDETYWKNAQSFIPERFESGEAEKSFAYLPFSKGPRRCIAELFAMTEISIIIVLILKNYKLAFDAAEFPKEEAFVSLKPIGGMPLKILPR